MTEQRNDPYTLSVEYMDLSVRAYNALKRERLFTAADIAKLTPKELAKKRNIGKRTVKEIQYQLLCHGIFMAGEDKRPWLGVRQLEALDDLQQCLADAHSVVRRLERALETFREQSMQEQPPPQDPQEGNK